MTFCRGCSEAIGILSFSTLVQQTLGGRRSHHVGCLCQRNHSVNEAGRCRCGRNSLPLVLIVVSHRLSGVEIESPLLAEHFILGGQLAFDKFLRVLLVNRPEKISLNPGGRDAGRVSDRSTAEQGRRPYGCYF